MIDDPLMELLKDYKGKILFWSCPYGCSDVVAWDHSKNPSVASCKKCKRTNENNGAKRL